MTTVEQGRRGEAAVAAYFVRLGYDVYMPTFGNARSDMIIDTGSKIWRIEVKTTKTPTPSGKHMVALRSIRHNNKENIVNKFDGTKSDYLAVYVEPLDLVHVFDSPGLHGRSNLTV